MQRLRTEVVEAAEAMEQLQAAKSALVNEKLVLAQALQRSTAALAGVYSSCTQPHPRDSILNQFSSCARTSGVFLRE